MLAKVHRYLASLPSENGSTCLFTCLTEEGVLPSETIKNVSAESEGPSPDQDRVHVLTTSPGNVWATNYVLGNMYEYNYFGTVVPTDKPGFNRNPVLATAIRFCTQVCHIIEEKAVERIFEYLFDVGKEYLKIHG